MKIITEHYILEGEIRHVGMDSLFLMVGVLMFIITRLDLVKMSNKCLFILTVCDVFFTCIHILSVMVPNFAHLY